MITINGTQKALPAGITLSSYLDSEHYNISRIAVERNGAIVCKSDYPSTLLLDGDTIEIVSFVGGG